MRKIDAVACFLALTTGLVFNARANVVYDCEKTNTAFSVTAATEELSDSQWGLPNDGEANKSENLIAFDTEVTDPLVYAPEPALSSDISVVKLEVVASVSASAPEFTNNPQAALIILEQESTIGNGTTETNWFGYVKSSTSEEGEWVQLSGATPVHGQTYAVSIEFDRRNSANKIRYCVDGVELGNGWYDNPGSGVSVSTIAFAGAGKVGDFSGLTVAEAFASFNGVTYLTFDAAIAAAKDAAEGVWSAQNPVVLYADANYTATATETLYINKNGKTLTVNGEVVSADVDDNTIEVTLKSDCEAIADGTAYYPSFAEALTAATTEVKLNKAGVSVTALAIDKNLTLDLNGKGFAAAPALTVAAGSTLTLKGDLAVTSATIGGAVVGGVLTVSGTLTGVNVEKVALAANSTFAYNGQKLSPASLTASATVTITGLDEAPKGTVVITAAGLSAASFEAVVASGLKLDVLGNDLKLVPEGGEYALGDPIETAGFDWTNGTVSVGVSVENSGTATVTFWAVDFTTGVKTQIGSDETVTGNATLTWNLNGLTPGTFTDYQIKMTYGDSESISQYGLFDSANILTDLWFGADPSTDPATLTNGGWGDAAPTVESGAYKIEGSATFALGIGVGAQGAGCVSFIETELTFDSFISYDDEIDEVDAFGGIAAGQDATGEPCWMAIVKDANEMLVWQPLDGGPVPTVNTSYVVLAEVDFLSPTKRIRYYVSADDGKTYLPLFNNAETPWLPFVADKQQLSSIGFKGAGKVYRLQAKLSDGAVAQVGNQKFATLAEAILAAGTTGEVKLLTNVAMPSDMPDVIIDANGKEMASSDSSKEVDTYVDDQGRTHIKVQTSTEIIDAIVVDDGNALTNDVDSLRAFLKQYAPSYVKANTSAAAIAEELDAVPENSNGLKLWQDYVLGVTPETSLMPVADAATDEDPENITLTIPALATATPSGDRKVTYKINETTLESETVKIPLESGNYVIKVIIEDNDAK